MHQKQYHNCYDNKYITENMINQSHILEVSGSQLDPGVPGHRDVPLGQVGDVPGGDHTHLHGGGGPLHPVQIKET